MSERAIPPKVRTEEGCRYYIRQKPKLAPVSASVLQSLLVFEDFLLFFGGDYASRGNNTKKPRMNLRGNNDDDYLLRANCNKRAAVCERYQDACGGGGQHPQTFDTVNCHHSHVQ